MVEVGSATTGARLLSAGWARALSGVVSVDYTITIPERTPQGLGFRV